MTRHETNERLAALRETMVMGANELKTAGVCPKQIAFDMILTGAWLAAHVSTKKTIDELRVLANLIENGHLKIEQVH
jgi:predicted nucleotidyltransferase